MTSKATEPSLYHDFTNHVAECTSLFIWSQMGVGSKFTEKSKSQAGVVDQVNAVQLESNSKKRLCSSLSYGLVKDPQRVHINIKYQISYLLRFHREYRYSHLGRSLE